MKRKLFLMQQETDQKTVFLTGFQSCEILKFLQIGSSETILLFGSIETETLNLVLF